MFTQLKKKISLTWKTELFKTSWYPNSRSCTNTIGRKAKLCQLPPLMVRRGEWRK